jgi:hypothetical protein
MKHCFQATPWQSRVLRGYVSKTNKITADRKLRTRDLRRVSTVLTEPSRHALFSTRNQYGFLKM